jgi:RNA polymerase sigma-70 factor (ECF subfamily)
MSDEEFLQEALAHLDMLYNLSRRLTPSRQEAEDLVQETYTRALKGWRRKPPQRTAPWLATICLNVVRSQHRSRSVRPDEILDSEPDDTLPAPIDTSEEALARLDAEAIRRALDRLPFAQKQAIGLMDLCGFTAAEAAKMLRVSRNTVLSRVHRGHKRLAVLLQEVMDDEA